MMTIIDWFLERSSRLRKIEEAIIEIRTIVNTTQRTPQTTTSQSLSGAQQRVVRNFDKTQLIQFMLDLMNRDYRTTDIRDEVKSRYGIGNSCFYKYFKIAKKQVESPTPRVTSRKKRSVVHK